jgi:hypothetical protein
MSGPVPDMAKLALLTRTDISRKKDFAAMHNALIVQ